MTRIYTFAASLAILLFFYCEKSFSQSTMTFFKDTTTRMGSSLGGSTYDNDKYIYLWGDGTGKSSLKTAQVRKIDTSGNEIWSTANTKLFSEGYISTAYIDSNFIYAFGVIKVQYQPSTFFFSKIDKLTGTVLLKIDNPNLNANGIIDVRDNGTDSIRVVCYTYDAAQSNPNWPPVVYLSINKTDGKSSAPAVYGLEGLAPLFIDNNDNAYYYTASDSLIKYNVAQKTVLWKNKEFLPGTYKVIPPSNLIKEKNKIYLFGDRYCRLIDDNNGSTIWNTSVPSRLYQEFWPSDIVIKNDTIYTTWLHPYSGAIEEYGHFSKIDKNSGTVYLNGTITDTSGINYQSTGYFRSYKIILDSLNNIYLLGHYYNDTTGQRVVKKISWNGSLISERKLSVDSIITRQYNVIGEIDLGYATGFLFKNKPYFIYSKLIYNIQQPSARVCFTSLSNDLIVKKEKFFDNSSFQFSSTVIDIKKYNSYTYVLKKQGLGIYLEKFLSNNTLKWRQEVSSNCFFTPSAFAIDSLGIICIIGYSLNCAPITDQTTLTSIFPINRIIFLDPNGNIINDFKIASITNNTQLPNLLGTENGFYLTFGGGVFKLDPSTGYSQSNTALTSNFSSGIFNDHSNKKFLTINDVDSIYIFSSRLSNSTDAFYYSVNKQTLIARNNQLSSPFPLGYLLTAVKSVKEKNVVYVSGVTGQGSFPTIVKLNYKTNTVIWKYSSNNIGDAFKIVEDDSGFVYALIRIIDSSKVVKLNNLNGKVLWEYAKYEEDYRNGRSIDLDINNANKMVVAAGFNIIDNFYEPYSISLNSETGILTDTQVLKGDLGEPNFIQAVESMQGSAIMIGGNLNTELEGGKNGFLLLKGKLISTPICSIKAYFKAIQDSINPAKFSFFNMTVPDNANTSYTWLVNDLKYSSEINAVYFFGTIGSYKISLIATNNTCKSQFDTTIFISKICPNVTPLFSFREDSVINEKMFFENKTTGIPSIKYYWNFGDGGALDSSENPTHIYAGPGTYQVCLSTHLFDSCTSQICNSISVKAGTNRLQVSPNPVNQNLNIIFDAINQGNYNLYLINSSGIIVFKKSFFASPGINKFTIPVNNLQAGIYILEVKGTDESLHKVFVKL